MSRTVDDIPAWLAGVYEVRPGHSCQGLHGQVDAHREGERHPEPEIQTIWNVCERYFHTLGTLDLWLLQLF